MAKVILCLSIISTIIFTLGIESSDSCFRWAVISMLVAGCCIYKIWLDEKRAENNKRWSWRYE